jgi:hypothetical protein
MRRAAVFLDRDRVLCGVVWRDGKLVSAWELPGFRNPGLMLRGAEIAEDRLAARPMTPSPLLIGVGRLVG